MQIKNFFNKIKSYILSHKILSIIILIVVVLFGYWIYGKITSTTGETRYVTGAVTKGTIISSVAGTGQVSASSQIDLKPNVSGAITWIGVSPGDKVWVGQNLFSIDDTDAQKAVRDAEANLKSAQIALQKIKIQDSTENMNASLIKAYSDSFNSVSSVFLDLSSTITGIDSILGQSNLSDSVARNSGNTALNYRKTAQTSYYAVLSAFQKNKTDWGVLDRSSSGTQIDTILSETYDTTKLLANAIKDTKSLVDYLAQDNSRSASDLASTQSTLATYTSTINTDLSSLLSSESNITNNKNTSDNGNLDVQTAELSVTQKENALTDAKQTLLDYYIKAPFSGIIASIPIERGENVSSGTVLGTIITSKQIATISLNEVDVAKISLGEKVTLTFDAVPDLTITGKVAEIDSIGTVSQGVVSYNVKISFDTSDARIKQGMSVNAEIITAVRQDVLTVPNSAVKGQGTSSYVEMFDTLLPTPLAGVQGSPSKVSPRQQAVTVGISDDTSTEIISGLKEGDEIVTKTITGTTTVSSAPSIFGAATGNRGGASPTRTLRGN